MRPNNFQKYYGTTKSVITYLEMFAKEVIKRDINVDINFDFETLYSNQRTLVELKEPVSVCIGLMLRDALNALEEVEFAYRSITGNEYKFKNVEGEIYDNGFLRGKDKGYPREEIRDDLERRILILNKRMEEIWTT